ncbi:MAG: hypothetical protein OEW06_10075 [Gemmatimonadota bacterium]|nr:hypothetical protein [Gemmatimonadota bacterium]
MTSARLHIANWQVCFVLLGLAALPATEARAQPGFRAWVGLYDPAHLGRLENENRLGQLCTDSSTLAECYAEQLAPAVAVYPLYAEPDTTSRPIGDLLVVATPGRGLTTHFRAAGARDAVTFTPDLFLQDWGYGPFLHQTISAQQGSWFQLPRRPWDEPVWVYRPSENELGSVTFVQAGDILEMRGAGWYVVAAEPDALVLRPEQRADLWCEEGDPPPLTPADPTRFSRAELLDADGHLVFRLKYLKGC